MKTRIVDLWQKNAIGVYLFDRLTEATVHDSKIGAIRTDGTVQFIDASEKPQAPGWENPVNLTPTIELPIPVVEEIVKWYQKAYPTRHADDAIRDARSTRDRLLTLVEVQAMNSVLPDAVAALKELRK